MRNRSNRIALLKSDTIIISVALSSSEKRGIARETVNLSNENRGTFLDAADLLAHSNGTIKNMAADIVSKFRREFFVWHSSMLFEAVSDLEPVSKGYCTRDGCMIHGIICS